ncbi:MAG: carboxypeptidase regulatory-like domain-containing protein [Deltaproteobacteria bacterium]|nr:MAG: carboxypeptidase regulatory-like domain-containing protein [Deltaproteobacteria bacterium]
MSNPTSTNLSRWLSFVASPCLRVALLVGCGLFPSVAGATSTDSECKQLYRQKKIWEAAQCFEDYLRQFLSKSKLSAEDRYQVGLALRNTNLMYRKAAKREPKVFKASFLREKALRYIKLYISGKYYATPSQRRYAVVIRDRIEQAIGYAQVTVLTGHPRATARILGYQYKGTGQGTFTLQLRPGTYTVVASYPNATTLARSISVKPNAPQLLTFQPSRRVATIPPKLRQRKVPPRKVVQRRSPPPRRTDVAKKEANKLVQATRPPPSRSRTIATWTLVGTGGALVVVGSVLVGLAVNVNNNANNSENGLRQKIQTGGGSVEDTRALLQEQAQANGLLQGGVVAGSVGLAAVLSGVVLWSTWPQPKASSSLGQASTLRKDNVRPPVHPSQPGADSSEASVVPVVSYGGR